MKDWLFLVMIYEGWWYIYFCMLSISPPGHSRSRIITRRISIVDLGVYMLQYEGLSESEGSWEGGER